MSKILSDWTKETITEIRKTKELDGIKCDNCGSVINTSKLNDKDMRIYYRVSCCEGISSSYSTVTEHFDICPNCLSSYVEKFLSRNLAKHVRIEKEQAVKVDVYSDKEGNFRLD